MQDSKGMIDVSEKDMTVRTAKASARIILGDEAFEVLRSARCPKGDILETARIAAVNAVKATPAVIPMCHTILIDAVEVGFAPDETNKSVRVNVGVKSTGKTGVEMEALVGASIACLTIYDMLKYTSREMIITEVKLLEKTGGKSGDFKRHD